MSPFYQALIVYTGGLFTTALTLTLFVNWVYTTFMKNK